MNEDLVSWSDEELCRACTPKAWEDRLSLNGCVATPLISAAVLFGWYLPWRKNAYFLEGVGLWLIGTFLLYNALEFIIGWRYRGQKAELIRRYGQRSFGVFRRDLRQEFSRESADRILLVQGRDLGGDQYAVVKIVLWGKETASGRLSVRIAPDIHSANFRSINAGFESHDVALNEEDAAALLTANTLSSATRLRYNQKTGSLYPCSVAVFERSGETVATCDLMRNPSSDEERSALDLVLRVLKLAEIVTDHPLVTGWEMPEAEREKFGQTFSVDGAKSLFRGHHPPDWVLLFHGAALPHGGRHTIRVVLYETDPPLGRLSMKTRAYMRSDTRDPRSALDCHERELSGAQLKSIFECVRSITPGADLKVPPQVRDGFPCELTVLHRSPAEQTRAECNLAGLTGSQSEEPLVKLMFALLHLRREVGTVAAHYGAYDSSGNIRIGNI